MSDADFLAELLAAAGNLAYAWDLDSDQIKWHGGWHRVFGDAPAPANSAAFFDAIYEDDRHIVFGAETDIIDREYRLRSKDGALIWVRERGTAEFHNHRLVRQCGLLEIVEKRATPPARDWHGRDELTGCFDRANMLSHIDKALDAARATRRPVAYLVLGIDKMSFVNEAVGMEAGDALLRGVAERLREILPARALLGRTAGDMFGILLPDPVGRDFALIAERLLQNFRHHPIVTSATPLHITVSIGGVRAPTVAHSSTEAMIFAEQALHDARRRGRNVFVEYIDSPERMQENRQLLELGERVKQALKQGSLRLAFQPVVDAESGKTLFYEALARLIADDGKPIAAAKFIPVVEQLGLALDFDRHVLDIAVREMEAAPELSLAINISGLTAAQANWPEHVRAILGPRPDVAKRMIVEITETAAIVDVSETRRFVDTLRELGARVALDDFGAGSTSIRHLRALSLSIMKIDKDLLHDVLNNREQQHLVRMLIEIARGLGLKTVAEGVETQEIAAWLRGARVDMMQGYYFGKPSLDREWASTKADKPAQAEAAQRSTAI